MVIEVDPSTSPGRRTDLLSLNNDNGIMHMVSDGLQNKVSNINERYIDDDSDSSETVYD